MKLIEALKIVNNQKGRSERDFVRVFLGCSFQPLHLKTYLTAHLSLILSDKHISVETGDYGDILGTLKKMSISTYDEGVLVVEWNDFDPRLGFRSLGGWFHDNLNDIFETFQMKADQIYSYLGKIVERVPLVVSLPTLPLPPIFYQRIEQNGLEETLLHEFLMSFASRIVKLNNLKLVSKFQLDSLSPFSQRLDLKSELSYGFPYQLQHTSHISLLCAQLIQSKLPKRGLITDLDNTLWRGILGDIGIEGVAWDLDHKSHIHALYQQLLHALAKSGVTIAVASKNSSELVEKAFKRKDILLPRDKIFPLEAHWRLKTDSVARILATWGIDADSVVFVDDSLIELDQVKSVYPKMECLHFPTQDEEACLNLFYQLRNYFGKEFISNEDLIRTQSLQINKKFRKSSHQDEQFHEIFISKTEAKIEFILDKAYSDKRAFELINKTNQFNLNGKKYSVVEWAKILSEKANVSLVVSYKDKYGPLGKIATIAGAKKDNGSILIRSWVMSCRAFGRRIEHRSLEQLFNLFDVSEIEFDFQPTERNIPLQEFLKSFFDEDLSGTLVLPKEVFTQRCPKLYHHFEIIRND